MALQKPKPGSRIGLGDPLCHVKTTEDLLDPSGSEWAVTEAGKWFEARREHILYSHVQSLNAKIPQMDSGDVNEIPAQNRTDAGGPVVSTKHVEKPITSK